MLLQEQCADAVDGGCEHGEDEQDAAAGAGKGKAVKLGCTKCRMSRKGCSTCRVKAGLAPLLNKTHPSPRRSALHAHRLLLLPGFVNVDPVLCYHCPRNVFSTTSRVAALWPLVV